MLEQDLAAVHDAHVVAHVLELAQVVRRDEHGRAVFGDVGQHEIPDLTAHDGVEPVDRLVEHEHVRPQAHRQPERGLLLHALGQAADLPLRVELKHLAELLIALGVELRVDAAVVAHHVRDRRLREIEHVVRDVGDARLDGRVFVHGLAVDVDHAAVRAVDARQMADERGLARAVRPDEAVHRAARHGHGHAVERAEAVKRFDDVFDFNHGSFLLRGCGGAAPHCACRGIAAPARLHRTAAAA